MPPALLNRPVVGAIAVAFALAAQTAILAPLVDDGALLPVALAYLLFVLIAAAAFGWVTGLLAAVSAYLILTFFFVPPLHTLTVQEPGNVAALAIFLAVAAIGAAMFSLLRRQVLFAQAARAESEMLLSLSNEVALGVSPTDAMTRFCQSISRSLHAASCAIVQQSPEWTVVAASGGLSRIPREEEALAAHSLRSRTTVTYPTDVRTAGLHRHQQRENQVTYVPLTGLIGEPAVIRLSGKLHAPVGVQADRLLTAFASAGGLVLHRARLQEETVRVESLQRADEFKATLLASVSHDLRSPLTAIRSSLDSLLDERLTWTEDERRALLNTIRSQSDRLTATVSKLLEMSRLDGGAVRPQIESIPVAQLYQEVALGTAPVLDGRSLDLNAPEGLAFRGDWGMSLQSLANLIENAAKYSTPGCPIHLAAERAGSKVLLSVADEGPGIDPGDLPHVFEKFYQGSSRGEPRGSGLGLSIVKAMVELSGGDVAVLSSPTGTTFTLSLPAAAAP